MSALLYRLVGGSLPRRCGGIKLSSLAQAAGGELARDLADAPALGQHRVDGGSRIGN